ncbi:uncharacterized protein [Fopius arisanus]|uniref:Uncharacterized protein n=1 Tax=Fopius arisanus TaxID=64838 RepID=A0A9R1U1Z8_9HYME|nr:PREDICTED: uncharacterized protein LOC105267242 [Fopius arisanus]
MDSCKNHSNKSKTNRRRRNSVLFHGSGNEGVISMREFGENSEVKLKGFQNAECSLKRQQRRKALGDVNRLSVAGPVMTIDCSSKLINRPRLVEKIQAQEKNVNFFAKPKKDFSKNRKSPEKLKMLKAPPARHLYGLLSQTTRSHEASITSLWHTWEEIEITGDDSDDCIEILDENFSADESSCSIPEINNNQIKMPKLKRQILEQRIIPAYSREILNEWKNAGFKGPEIKEEKIYWQKDFNIQNFLKRSYNPYLHFLSEHRQCFPSETAVNFLSNCFKNIKKAKIEETYEIAKYNMSRAARVLRLSKSSRGKRRQNRPIEPENITQYQEMEFIRYFCKLP